MSLLTCVYAETKETSIELTHLPDGAFDLTLSALNGSGEPIMFSVSRAVAVRLVAAFAALGVRTRLEEGSR